MEHKRMSSGLVRYPDLRSSLKVAASCLADRDFQSRVWANPTSKTPADKFPFAEAIAFVIDDMGMAEPSALIGDVLVDEEEQAQFEALSAALGSLLDRIGPNGSYQDAARSAEWEAVRTAANELYQSLTGSDPS